MKVIGSIELQKEAPARLVGAIRAALSKAGYGHEEAALELQTSSFAGNYPAGITVHMFGDADITMTLREKDAGKMFACRLSTKLPGDTGAQLNNRLYPLLKAENVLAGEHGSGLGTESVPVTLHQPSQSGFAMKVYNLTDADSRRFPVKALDTLVRALVKLDIDQDVTLRLEIMIRSDAECMGVQLDEDTIQRQSIHLTLQDYHPSSRARCVLKVNNDESGQWLYDNLSEQLAASSAPATDSGASMNGSGTTDGEQAMPMTNRYEEDDGGYTPAASPVRAPAAPIQKIPAAGFTKKVDNINLFLGRLRQECTGGVVTFKDATRVLRQMIEPKPGGKPTQGAGLIVAALKRMGYLIPVSGEKKKFTILAAGQSAMPIGPGRKTSNGAVPELPPDHPVRQRIDRLSGVLAQDAKRRAEVASKRERAEELLVQSQGLAAEAQKLLEEAAAAETMILGEEDLGAIDEFLNRVGNIAPSESMEHPPIEGP